MAKRIFLILFLLMVSAIIPASSAQISTPVVDVSCFSDSNSGTVEIDVSPDGNGSGVAHCSVDNLNPYYIRVEIKTETNTHAESGDTQTVIIAPYDTYLWDENLQYQLELILFSEELRIEVDIYEVNGIPYSDGKIESSMTVTILQYSEMNIIFKGPKLIEVGQEEVLIFEVYNHGNWADTITIFSPDESQNGFEILAISPSEFELEANMSQDVEVKVKAPSGVFMEQLIFTLAASSEFSCRFGVDGCNNLTLITNISVENGVVPTISHLIGLGGTSMIIQYSIVIFLPLTGVALKLFTRSKTRPSLVFEPGKPSRKA